MSVVITSDHFERPESPLSIMTGFVGPFAGIWPSRFNVITVCVIGRDEPFDPLC